MMQRQRSKCSSRVTCVLLEMRRDLGKNILPFHHLCSRFLLLRPVLSPCSYHYSSRGLHPNKYLLETSGGCHLGYLICYRTSHRFLWIQWLAFGVVQHLAHIHPPEPTFLCFIGAFFFSCKPSQVPELVHSSAR